MRPLTVALAALISMSPAIPGWSQEGGNPRPAKPRGPDDVVLAFRGVIDGAERIRIDRSGASWEHLEYDLPPEPVTLNGILWDPKENLALKNSGKTRFLKKPVDFGSARVNRIQGRGIVAVETSRDSVILYLNDAPGEASTYEFQVIFRPPGKRDGPAKPAPSGTVTLKIAADIDGTDELHIDGAGARWVHHTWQWPNEVTLNGVKWNPEQSATLENKGTSRFLKLPVDFATAKVVKRAGRGTIVMEKVEDGIVVYFSDTPFEGAPYEIAISFQRKEG